MSKSFTIPPAWGFGFFICFLTLAILCAYMCMHMCVHMYVCLGVYVLVCTPSVCVWGWYALAHMEARGEIGHPPLLAFCLFPQRQDRPLSLALGWQPSPRNPPASAPTVLWLQVQLRLFMWVLGI